MRADEKVLGLDACAVACHLKKVQLVRHTTLPETEIVRAPGLFTLIGDPTGPRLLHARAGSQAVAR